MLQVSRLSLWHLLSPRAGKDQAHVNARRCRSRTRLSPGPEAEPSLNECNAARASTANSDTNKAAAKSACQSSHHQPFALPATSTSGTCIEEGSECPICLENYTEALPRHLTPCAHAFHATCISDWAARSSGYPTCPTCLSPLSPVDFSPESAPTPEPASVSDSDKFIAITGTT